MTFSSAQVMRIVQSRIIYSIVYGLDTSPDYRPTLEVGRYCHGRYRYDIDISDPKYRRSFTAVLFGLIIYFNIASKVVNGVNVIS